jgi:hypothetical protein
MSMTTDGIPLSRHAVVRAVLALTAAAALAAAGCGDDDDTTTTESGAGAGGGDDLSISVTTPEDGATVGDSFEVEVDTSVDIGEPDTGLHHVHLYYDGNTDDGEYDLVYDPTFTVERDLGAGEHTIEAVVANADHSLTDARDEVTVTVGDEATGSGGGTGPGDDDTGETDDTGTTDATEPSDDGGDDGY